MKKLILLFMTICISQMTFAQATDLVVDCQTPGWLSSKINYGDQQTVQNLKVTGYLNDDDIKFIGTLIMMNLHGVLDLGDVSMVNNSLDGNFGLPATGGVFHYPLQKMIFPKSLESYNGWDINMKADSVVFDTKISVITKSYFRSKNIQHLILGENVTTVNGYAMPHYLYFKSINLPSSLITIEDFAFNNGLNDLSSSNISEFPNLEYIGYLAFVNDMTSSSQPPQRNRETLPDTIKLPKIKEYSVAAFDYKEGMHIFLGEDVTNVYPKSKTAYSKDWMPSLTNVTFHIAALTPPSTGGGWNNGLKVYVPKEAVETYKAHSGWKYANILAEPKPLEQIELTEHEIALDVDEHHQLTANPIPANADDITIIWSSDNEQVATVNGTGIVKAIACGEANITACSADGTIKDACKVIVKTHAESISLQTSSIKLANIGDTYQLEVTVLPENAIDKTVTWKSANEQICMVTNSGLVIATGYGSTLVIATTVDGGFMAYCTVTVESATGIEEINTDTLNDAIYFSPDGKRLNQPQRGINIMRTNDGTMKKVIKK